MLILTHPHHDHLAGLVEVLQRYRVEHVLYPTLDDESPLYREWLELIEEEEIECTTACAGQQIALGGGVAMDVLNPPMNYWSDTESDIDNNSVVLRLTDGDISFLLTGDIMREIEWELVRKGAGLSGTILKVAHHGSDTSTTPEFLAAVNPQAAVICCGAGNKFGHPSAEVVDRLEERLGGQNLYRTDENGTIEFITDGERLWVEAER